MSIRVQKCNNCAHLSCLFNGEDCLPVYRNSGKGCWVDPKSETGKQYIEYVETSTSEFYHKKLQNLSNMEKQYEKC